MAFLPKEGLSMGAEGKAPLRILVLVPSLGGGGAERMAVNLCRGLDRDLWRPTVVTFEEADDLVSELPDDVPRRSLEKSGRAANAALPLRLAGVLREERPDLIFTRVYFTALVGYLANRLAGRPAPLVSAVDSTLSRLIAAQSLAPLRRWACRRILPRIDRLVAVSGAVKQDLARNFDVPPARCAVIHNSVDIARARRLMREEAHGFGFAGEEPVVLSVGRLEPPKNFPLLLRAFARLRERRAARLVILGEGSQRPRLEALADRLGVTEHVRLPGFHPNPFKFMRAADVFVLSSDHEGFGNVIVEAMACGAPVVSTRCGGGAEEIVTPERDGLLVPSGDEAALAGAVEHVLDSPELRRRLSRNARRRARDFDNRAVTRRYEELFAAVFPGYNANTVNRL